MFGEPVGNSGSVPRVGYGLTGAIVPGELSVGVFIYFPTKQHQKGSPKQSFVYKWWLFGFHVDLQGSTSGVHLGSRNTNTASSLTELGNRNTKSTPSPNIPTFFRVSCEPLTKKEASL